MRTDGDANVTTTHTEYWSIFCLLNCKKCCNALKPYLDLPEPGLTLWSVERAEKHNTLYVNLYKELDKGFRSIDTIHGFTVPGFVRSTVLYYNLKLALLYKLSTTKVRGTTP